jgi:hypothetical protein
MTVTERTKFITPMETFFDTHVSGPPAGGAYRRWHYEQDVTMDNVFSSTRMQASKYTGGRVMWEDE